MNRSVIIFAAASGLMLIFSPALAGSATWLAKPNSGDWNTAGNWTPGGPPNGSADIATLQTSAVNNLSLSANAQVSGITFSTGSATVYTFTAGPTVALTVGGFGVKNNSGMTQNFVAAGNQGTIQFLNSASAGLNAVFTTNGGSASGEMSGITQFRDNSSANNATFITYSGFASGAFGGTTQFLDNSTAGNGRFTTNGRTVADAGSGVTLFYDTASAGNASFVTKGSAVEGGLGGYVIFFGSSTAGDATFSNEGSGDLLAGGGVTQFFDSSSAGNGVFTNYRARLSSGLVQFFQSSTADHGAFVNRGVVEFHDSSSAGNGVFIVDGVIRFWPDTTAGNGTFVVNGNPMGSLGGFMLVGGSAGDANFTVNGSTAGRWGGVIQVADNASAANGSFIINGANGGAVSNGEGICGTCQEPDSRGALLFLVTATADNATLVANGGVNGGDGGLIDFAGQSTGGIAQVKLFGNASLYISDHADQGVTIGSLEGDGGTVFLGSKNLAVGSNNLSTTFGGVLKDGDGRPGGGGGTGGSLTKIGTGILTLSGANHYTYTGPTTVNGGKLKVEGSITSPVSVNNGGTLAGSGTTANVVVNNGGIVAPGDLHALHINANYVQHAGGVLRLSVAGVDPSVCERLEVTSSVALDGTLEVRFVNGFLPTNGDVFKLLHIGGAFAGAFAQIIFPDLRAGFQCQGEFVNGYYQITALNDGVAATGFLNISTRMQVGTGDNALIGGFIVTGNVPKRVILRAIGPSLSVSGTPLPDRLDDPALEFRDSTGALISFNDNWMESAQVQEIIDSGIPPSDEREAAIVATLAPGNYTAVMRGVGATTGIGVVEVYDLAPEVAAKLANISTRGFVETSDNVMIGGFIAGNQATHVLVRALGPSLTQSGVPDALADPTLELHNAQGAVIAFNNDWQEADAASIEATGIPPTNETESAILATLAPGPYTAIVRGQNDTTGVGLVEVYDLQ